MPLPPDRNHSGARGPQGTERARRSARPPDGAPSPLKSSLGGLGGAQVPAPGARGAAGKGRSRRVGQDFRKPTAVRSPAVKLMLPMVQGAAGGSGAGSAIFPSLEPRPVNHEARYSTGSSAR
jgi:hypothetical protein